MNKEQLEGAAMGWLHAASNDLGNRLNRFMEDTDSDSEDLADLLDLDLATVQAIVNYGDLSNLSALDLIKLFVANDLALEIKPVSETPMAHGMDAPDGRIPVGHPFKTPREAIPQNPNPYSNTRPSGYRGQPRDAHGRFIARVQRLPEANPTPFETSQNIPYDTMSDDALKSIIARNLWDSEIDINSASRDELKSFIINKERQFAEMNGGGTTHNAQPRRQTATQNMAQWNHPSDTRSQDMRGAAPSDESRAHRIAPNADGENQAKKLLKALTDVLTNNPSLAEQIRNFGAD